jgi:holo-[acyl-carrier protein] synthase
MKINNKNLPFGLIGIGIDIIEVERIKKIIRKKGDFLKRVFTDKEIKYCIGKKNKYERLAVRFTAKEAVWKAAGLKGVPLREISIVKAPGGKPGIFCSNPKMKGVSVDISLSHSKHYACAVAIAVKKGTGTFFKNV